MSIMSITAIMSLMSVMVVTSQVRHILSYGCCKSEFNGKRYNALNRPIRTLRPVRSIHPIRPIRPILLISRLRKPKTTVHNP
jgi:hypothetical protein